MRTLRQREVRRAVVGQPRVQGSDWSLGGIPPGSLADSHGRFRGVL